AGLAARRSRPDRQALRGSLLMSKPLTALSAAEMHEFAAEMGLDLGQPPPPSPAQPVTRKIVVGILAYDARGYWRTFMSLMQAVMDCGAQGWQFAYILREGDSMVARGRSFIASQFLENQDTADGTDPV